MLLFDAHIIETFRHFLGQKVHAASRCHRRSDSHDLVVCLCKFEKNCAEHILVAAFALAALRTHTCLGIEDSWRMPCGLILFRRSIAFSLLRHSVEKERTAHGAKLLQGIDNL